MKRLSRCRPSAANLTAGYIGVFDDSGRPLRLGAEYRFRAMGRWSLIPAVGFATAEDGAGGEVARRFHGEYRIGAA